MRRLLIIFAAAALAGCTPAAPHRTDVAFAPGSGAVGNCAPVQSAEVRAQDGKSSFEHENEFDLYFVEFDDQGLLYPASGGEFGRAACQLDALMAGLDATARDMPGLSIVVYVHGWKHGASAADRDVREFRHLLLDAALVEEAKKKFSLPPHRVVGIFVSWRGKSLDLPEPLSSLSFWDRKNTAEHVAQGETRALFARLRAFQTLQNNAQTKSVDVGEQKVFMILMGHSFGGLILYNSVAQSLINSVYEANLDASGRKVPPRFADMVILANPAIEALRYTPLQRAAAATAFDQYQTPIFVSITSKADWATGMAFPLGRYFSTVFQKHASDEETEANHNTIGHVDAYITHELDAGGKGCGEGWKPVTDPKQDGAFEQEQKNLTLELEQARRFFGDNPAARSLESGWTREFCGNTVLKHVKGHPNSPIWNIQTTKAVVPSHNEITKPEFINFVRQLYHDAVLNRIISARQGGTAGSATPRAAE
jgi:hypothetical protein